MQIRSARRSAALFAFIALAVAACDSPPLTEPIQTNTQTKPQNDVITQTFTSGSNVDTWNAIPLSPEVPFGVWQTTVCTSQPAIGINDPRWTNPHKAFVANGAAFQSTARNAYPAFTSDWINSWPTFEESNIGSYGGPLGPLGDNFTKYSTDVSGNGHFVLYLAADNCSWVYLADADGNNAQLVGVQKDVAPHANQYPVTLNGNHKLIFIVFDGGGQAGGMFSLQTNTNVVFTDSDGDGLPDVSETNIYHTDSHNPDTDGDGISDGAEVAAGTDPLVVNVIDADHDGILDNVDNCPATANADQADLDHDGVGDACDPDIDGDGYLNAADAFPTDSHEWADTDHDGVGDNTDAFPTDPTEQVDTDLDRVGDHKDNCVAVANADQADLDHDGIGDACDSDIDGDGVANAQDVYPTNPLEWADSDHDGIGDNADPFDTSNTGPFLVVGTCTTNVANWSNGEGLYANDQIATAYSSSRNHGAFLSAVAALTDGWKKGGHITGRDEGAITSCAARTK